MNKGETKGRRKLDFLTNIVTHWTHSVMVTRNMYERYTLRSSLVCWANHVIGNTTSSLWW